MTRGAARCCVPRMNDHKVRNMKIYIQKKRKAKAKSKKKAMKMKRKKGRRKEEEKQGEVWCDEEE